MTKISFNTLDAAWDWISHRPFLEVRTVDVDGDEYTLQNRGNFNVRVVEVKNYVR